MVRHSKVVTVEELDRWTLDKVIELKIDRYEKEGYELKNVSISTCTIIETYYTATLHFQKVDD